MKLATDGRGMLQFRRKQPARRPGGQRRGVTRAWTGGGWSGEVILVPIPRRIQAGVAREFWARELDSRSYSLAPHSLASSFSRSRGFSTMRQRQGLAEAERRWEPQIRLTGRSRQVSVWFWWTEKLMTKKWEPSQVPKRPFFCHQFFCPVSDSWIPDRLPHGPFLSQAGTLWRTADRRQVEGCERWKMR